MKPGREISIVPPALGTSGMTPCQWLQECKKYGLDAYLPLFGERNANQYAETITPYVKAVKEIYGETDVIVWEGPSAKNCYEAETYTDDRQGYQDYWERFRTMKSVCEDHGLSIKYVNVQAVASADHIPIIKNAARDVDVKIRISLYTRTIDDIECIVYRGRFVPIEEIFKIFDLDYGFGLNCIGYDQIDRAISQLKSVGLIQKLEEVLPNASGISGHQLTSGVFGDHAEVMSCSCKTTMLRWVSEITGNKNFNTVGLCCGSSFEQVAEIQRKISKNVPSR